MPPKADADDLRCPEVRDRIRGAAPYSAPTQIALNLGRDGLSADAEYRLGQRLAPGIAARFVADSGGWWKYNADTGCWRDLASDRIHELMAQPWFERVSLADRLSGAQDEECAEQVRNAKKWGALARSMRGGLWHGLRVSLSGSEPDPPFFYFPVWNGVVDLRDGTLLPHDPALETRSRAPTRYIPHLNGGRGRDLLHERLDEVFTEENKHHLFRLLGMGATGQAHEHRPQLWIYGESGSGKSTIQDLLQHTFGALWAELNRTVLDNETGINAQLTDIIVNRPRYLGFEEFTQTARAQTVAQLNSFFGDVSRTARRPHGVNQTGKVIGLGIFTVASPPRLDRASGQERRSAVIGTKGYIIPDRRIDKAWIRDPEVREAFLYEVLQAAMIEMGGMSQLGYAPPEGDARTRKQFLDDADPLQAWLDELPSDVHGARTAHVLAMANADRAAGDLNWRGRGRHEPSWRQNPGV